MVNHLLYPRHLLYPLGDRLLIYISICIGKFQRDIPVYNRKVDDDAAHQPGSFGNTERGR